MGNEKDKGLGYRDIPQTVFTDKDNIINKGPCIIYDMVLTGSGGQTNVKVYDGLGTNDGLKFWLEVANGTSFSWHSKRGTFFRKGLYVNAADTRVKFSITFVPYEYEGKQG